MDESTFKTEMMRARMFSNLGEKPDYFMGYQRGLRRQYHGEIFGTDQEHDQWLGFINSQDPVRVEMGKGYRAGLEYGRV